MTLKETPQARDRVVDILRFCWKTLHLYGKKPEDFDGLCATYIGFLGKYPPDKVCAAFEKYIRNRREFPSPSDIIGILEGRIKRDGAYYMRLCQKIKEGAFLSDDEHRYMRKYENQVEGDWE